MLNWDDLNGSRHFVSYTFDVPLTAGDLLQLRASAPNTVVYLELSSYRIGELRTPSPEPAPTTSVLATCVLVCVDVYVFVCCGGVLGGEFGVVIGVVVVL